MQKVNIETIKNSFPKAFEAYKKWLNKVTTLEGKDLDEYADIVIIATPRALFDFFDLQEIFITISNHGIADDWSYDIGDAGTHVDSRAEADQMSIMDAFELLETKLL